MMAAENIWSAERSTGLPADEAFPRRSPEHFKAPEGHSDTSGGYPLMAHVSP